MRRSGVPGIIGSTGWDRGLDLRLLVLREHHRAWGRVEVLADVPVALKQRAAARGFLAANALPQS